MAWLAQRMRSKYSIYVLTTSATWTCACHQCRYAILALNARAKYNVWRRFLSFALAIGACEGDGLVPSIGASACVCCGYIRMFDYPFISVSERILLSSNLLTMMNHKNWISICFNTFWGEHRVMSVLCRDRELRECEEL